MLTKVLIVDDEPLAVELLETYVSRVPGFVLAGRCSNALEAFAMLSRSQVDVVFLDINMPEVTGMELVKMLRDPPAIVFTTAYSEYAAESYNYNVVDYLVKPITFDRFMKAVQKITAVKAAQSVASSSPSDTIFVRSDAKMIRVDLGELQLVEGYKNYVRLWKEKEKVIVHNTMKSFEQYLAQYPAFVRVHKSYIVNTAFIAELAGNSIRMGNEIIAIGATYRNDVFAALARFKQF